MIIPATVLLVIVERIVVLVRMMFKSKKMARKALFECASWQEDGIKVFNACPADGILSSKVLICQLSVNKASFTSGL